MARRQWTSTEQGGLVEVAYGRVEETFWSDPKMRGVSEDARHFMLYLLTGPHRNRLGCVLLDPHYAMGDLQWDRLRVEEAMRELADLGRIAFDPWTRVVLVWNYLKHNPLENQNVVTSAVRVLEDLPDTPLLGVLLECVREYRRGHYGELEDALDERVGLLGGEIVENPVWGIDKPSSNGSDRVGRSSGYGSGSGKGSGNTSTERKTEDAESDDPVLWMNDIWHEVLGVENHPIKLTNERRRKYRLMYEEQLDGTPDPRLAWRAVLHAVTKSSHHMSKRKYQMPESILRNDTRRDSWVQEAIDVLSDGPTAIDRKMQDTEREVLEYLKSRRAA